jgi:xylan 1,4-beta-xylosidase
VVAIVMLLLAGAAAQTSPIVIDANAPGAPFPHFWEEMFGSGRAILSLRQGYRDDLREVKKVTDFRYVRFHNVLHDEVGVYDEDRQGKPIYNFTYVDQIYDGLLQQGVRPVVEISFTPKKLASDPNALHPFWYKQNVSPPKDYAKWDDLIRAFARHLVERYGLGEVAQWYFEVWNEPNIDFWAGEPKQPTYFELYDHTARALKSVSPLLRVGGPATAAADWVDAFLAHLVQRNVPIDFVSSHGYADDTEEHLFHNNAPVPMEQRVCRAIVKVRGQIKASGHPHLPLFWTEWNVPGRDELRDTTYVAPAVAYDILQCDGSVDMMSFWTFDDVFEEDGPPHDSFHGGFGLIAAGGIKKPSYFGFSLLHQLGYERLANSAQNALVTRRADGTLVIAVWNLGPPQPGAAGGPPVRVQLQLRNIATSATVLIHRADDTHGNTLAIFRRLGSPQYPTPAQKAQINREGELPLPEAATLNNGGLELAIPQNGLAIVEVPWQK